MNDTPTHRYNRESLKAKLKTRWRPFDNYTTDGGDLKRRKTTANVQVVEIQTDGQKQFRERVDELPEILDNRNNVETSESSDRSPVDDCGDTYPPGAMAPPNTTQYLMDKTYEDMEMDGDYFSSEVHVHTCCGSLPQQSVSTALNSSDERCLEFLQADFEEVYAANRI